MYLLLYKTRALNVVQNKISKQKTYQINRKDMEIFIANKFYSKNKYTLNLI